jgi:hypothetical protein
MFLRWTPLSDREGQSLSDCQLIYKLGGQSEPYTQRASGSDPQEAFVPSDGLANTNVSTSNDPIKGRRHLGFLEFQLQGSFGVTGIDEKLFDAFNVPMVSFGLELGVFKLFLSDELGIPHFAGALQVCFENLDLRLPIIEIGFGTGGPGASPFQVSYDLSVVQFGEELSLAHTRAGFDENLHYDAFALGGYVDLILDHDGT